jgi:hypothetical protein
LFAREAAERPTSVSGRANRRHALTFDTILPALTRGASTAWCLRYFPEPGRVRRLLTRAASGAACPPRAAKF